MFGFEQRWVEVVMSSFAPDPDAPLAVRPGEVRWVAQFERMASAMPPLARAGLRVGIWLLMFGPVLAGRGLRPLDSLPPLERAAVLERLLEHRAFFVRELALLVKVMTCMALMGTPSVRARSAYDEGAYRDPWERDHQAEPHDHDHDHDHAHAPKKAARRRLQLAGGV